MARFVVNLVLVVGLGTACGANIPFEGVYVGERNDSFDCRYTKGASDEAGTSAPEWSLRLTDTDEGIEWSACGETTPLARATIDGHTATIEKVTCPSRTYAGIVETRTFESGKLTLDGDTLGLDLMVIDVFEGAHEGYCRIRFKGSLTRVHGL